MLGASWDESNDCDCGVQKKRVVGLSKKIKISDLRFDDRNANKGTARGRGAIEQSIQKSGFGRSILIDRNNKIIAGNKSCEVAGENGFEDVIIVETDGRAIVAVKRTDLDLNTDEKAKFLAIADNRAGELSLDWSPEVLAEINTEIDLGGLWTSDEISELLADLNPGNGGGSGQEDDDSVRDLIDRAEDGSIDSRVSLGQAWKLGRHYIACADSTDEKNVRQLLAIANVKSPHMVWADPPYGYSYQSNSRTKKFDVIKNDDVILKGFVQPVKTLTDGWVLVCTSWKVVKEWLESCEALGNLQNMIVWDKGGGGMGDLTHSLSTDYELILAYNRGKEIYGKRLGSVWSIGKDAPSSYVHATQKPVALIEQAMASFSLPASTVFDPFLGSGTSIIAAQQMDGNRTVLGFELSPEYCEVICRRYESLTGEVAELVGTIDG